MFISTRSGFTFLLVFILSSSSACRFEAGFQYRYLYQARALVDGVRATPSFNLTCSLLVTSSQTACEAQFQVTDCELKETDGKTEKKVDSSDILSEEIGKHPFTVKYHAANDSSGTNIADLFVSPQEKVNILNLKRGIISAFQLPALPLKHQGNGTNDTITVLAQQDDIFGSCPAQVSATVNQEGNITKWKVKTSRDLVVCNLSHVSKTQQSFLSFIQVMVGGEKRGLIRELSYSHESKVTCSYTASSTWKIETVECHQTQALDPGRDITKRELSKIT
ncbi:apolipoprotein B-100 [Elysia marginata]|uniref:Apolipoprotein B-100 n=1 Tax=Elysia marginata TaxID=1093978 RepID=A0AAV4JCA5_9GAST|nr:apolipoprotein B-100 [Elysia marginata]